MAKEKATKRSLNKLEQIQELKRRLQHAFAVAAMLGDENLKRRRRPWKKLSKQERNAVRFLSEHMTETLVLAELSMPPTNFAQDSRIQLVLSVRKKFDNRRVSTVGFID